ncbi:GIY-YIG nuclease family protein [Shewanella fidelis]|uniref:GIY-YIG nuclease family protein n=1 Tax=Shewanella fidelis TaxID=173509 RepID=A0AAW8NHB7_9GAMM|nr:GIY-YIG nuclease family protein [Shewanella fidelis]MDR8522719.1 GIY-YIG nuclease family protein [Shewanella fidelis]MDW4812334.1 GIY-YIG nuclease family protein [Shewanella fidelis]MDW4816001.1 GIY-YIG nuclease family protein [Shewanella fidelis]MDW4820575.1 GIY-YIG nuclease family protein [Shewanella fidelis]MDW4824798.1 GIY-YIG nuclease family protein [Shewanella fidelis]
MTTTAEVTHSLSPLSNAIVDKAIDNVTRKLIGGARNKNNSQAGSHTPSLKQSISDSLAATSAEDVMQVANRGVAWKEMISKSLSHGISSLASMQYDGQFTVKNGIAEGLHQVPGNPGVYVVFDKNNTAIYVGDSTNIRSRWHAGHLNENRQKLNNGEQYKLSEQLTEGCTVKFISCESKETAAAIEAHLIKQAQPSVNAREELLNEQGTRSNIEAKKMKDASGSTASLAAGATKAAIENAGWSVLETLITTCIKALKDELVDIVCGGTSKLKQRIKRLFNKVWSAISHIIKNPGSLLKGIFEFIVNAFSSAIRKIYQLARNIYDLGYAAWQLYKGKQALSKAELIEKISETIITSGCLVIWDALDPIIEAQLTALIPPMAPYSPYIAATISAIGFGVSSHYLSGFVPQIVEKIVNYNPMQLQSLEQQRSACEQLIINAEKELIMINGLEDYMRSTKALVTDLDCQTQQLTQHQAIETFSIEDRLNRLSLGVKA